MSDLDVRIVKLEPMRVASVRAVSESPEVDAWSKLRSWAEPKGFLQKMFLKFYSAKTENMLE